MLDVDSLHLAEVGADARDLVLDVHEERGVLSQVDLGGVEHALEQDAVALACTGLSLVARGAGVGLLGGVGGPRQHRVLVATELLHEGRAVRRRVDVGVGRVLPEVFFLLALCSAGSVRQDVDFQFLARHQLEATHGLRGDLGFLVRGEFYNRVAPIIAGVWVFWQLDSIDLAERRKELTNVGL